MNIYYDGLVDHIVNGTYTIADDDIVEKMSYEERLEFLRYVHLHGFNEGRSAGYEECRYDYRHEIDGYDENDDD